MKSSRLFLPLISLVLLGILFAPHTLVLAQASTVVNDQGDTVATDSKCTLREAIMTETGSPQADCGASGTGLITFADEVATVTLEDEIVFTPTSTLKIDASTRSSQLPFFIDANNNSRIFDIDNTNNQDVTLQGVNMKSGHVSASGAQGAGILNEGGTLTLSSLIMTSNINDNGNGGAIYNNGTLNLSNVTIDSNQALRGGGIFNAADGTLQLNPGQISQNLANRVSGVGGLGGGLYNDGSATAFQASVFTRNHADLNGGGIYTDGDFHAFFTQIGGPISEDGNTASSGGGLFEDSDGGTTVSYLIVSNNKANNGQGGGFYLSGSAVNDHIDNSTFVLNYDNSENDDNRYGGAIYGTGDVALYIANSTLVGNLVSDAGGAIYWASSNLLRINNSTIVANGDHDIAGGIVMADGFNEIDNSIVNFNTTIDGSDPDCGVDGSADDTNWVDSIFNLISTTDCGGFLTSENAVKTDDASATLDDTLANNGGQTPTVALVEGSPAINAGDPDDNAIYKCEEHDQRDYGRKGVCDIGAFEFNGIAPGDGGETGGGSSSSSGHHDDKNTETTPNYATGGCAALSGGSFTYSGEAGVDCRVINADGVYKADAAEIGNMDVINRGVLQAIDVFRFDNNGNSLTTFDSPVTVCLQGTGQFLFINAANTPRTVEGPASYTQNGYTCAQIPNAGIAVLVPGEAAAATAPIANVAQTALVAAGETALENCTVTTEHRINLHTDPSTSSTIITTLPFGISYQATARTTVGDAEWIKVIWSNTQGWIRNDLISTSGTCS